MTIVKPIKTRNVADFASSPFGTVQFLNDYPGLSAHFFNTLSITSWEIDPDTCRIHCACLGLLFLTGLGTKIALLLKNVICIPIRCDF
jgi:hypothetical protein